MMIRCSIRRDEDSRFVHSTYQADQGLKTVKSQSHFSALLRKRRIPGWLFIVRWVTGWLRYLKGHTRNFSIHPCEENNILSKPQYLADKITHSLPITPSSGSSRLFQPSASHFRIPTAIFDASFHYTLNQISIELKFHRHRCCHSWADSHGRPKRGFVYCASLPSLQVEVECFSLCPFLIIWHIYSLLQCSLRTDALSYYHLRLWDLELYYIQGASSERWSIDDVFLSLFSCLFNLFQYSLPLRAPL